MSIRHVSEMPWSSYSEGDYTVQQWHNACLIHLHDGAPTSKSECKLPVKTPNGSINRNGVHAAAAALAGARGGVHASSDQKDSARKSIVRLYGQLNEQPPPSMKQSNQEEVGEFLNHHGVRGQKWGVRKARGDRSSFKKAAEARKAGDLRKQPIHSLTNKQLKTVNDRISLEQNFRRMNPTKVAAGKKAAMEVLATVGIGVSFFNLATSPAGKSAIAAGRKVLSRG